MERTNLNRAQIYVKRIQKKITIYPGKNAFMAAALEEPDLVPPLLNASFHPDVTAPGINLVPHDKHILVISRAARGNMITSITFDDNSSIAGNSFKRLIGAYRLAQQGYQSLVWANEGSECVSALLIPESDVVAGTRSRQIDDENKELEMKTAHFHTCSKNVYAPIKDLLKVTSVVGISLSHVKSIIEAMNGLSKIVVEYDYPEPTLDVAVAILTNPDTTKLELIYGSALLGAFNETLPLEARIASFLKYGPSIPLVGALNIPKPYTKNMVNRELKPVAKQMLNGLADDAQVLLSTLTITSQFYSNVLATTEVNVSIENIGIKNGSKLQLCDDLTTVSAETYRKIIDAIVSSRAKKVVSKEAQADEEATALDNTEMVEF